MGVRNDARPDKVAQDAITMLEKAFEENGCKLQRWTPSIKIGRRYLGVQVEGTWYAITLEVEA